MATRLLERRERIDDLLEEDAGGRRVRAARRAPRQDAARADRATRAVPFHAVSRAVHFGGLGIGLAAGAAAAAMRRAVGGDNPAGSLLATDANVERLAGTLCRLRGAALKV